MIWSRPISIISSRSLLRLWDRHEIGPVSVAFNTLRPRQNGPHFADDIFKCIFLKENIWISNKISLIFVPKVRINNIPVLGQIMAWRRWGDKPLSEPMMVDLLTHICVTRPQWVKKGQTIAWTNDDSVHKLIFNEAVQKQKLQNHTHWQCKPTLIQV